MVRTVFFVVILTFPETTKHTVHNCVHKGVHKRTVRCCSIGKAYVEKLAPDEEDGGVVEHMKRGELGVAFAEHDEAGLEEVPKLR